MISRWLENEGVDADAVVHHPVLVTVPVADSEVGGLAPMSCTGS
jgi:hypothetical protein